MNTLKLKVLLILLNRCLWKSVMQSVLIWLLTCITGCTIWFALFSEPPKIQAYFLSLAYSSPAIVIAVLVLYFLPFIQSIPVRVVLAIISILATCSLIIGFMGFKSGDYGLIVLILSPFIFSSIIWFFLIAGVQFTEPNQYES